MAFHPAFYNLLLSQISPQQQQYNLQPHCTYLAYFGRDMVKVGIAHKKRLFNRWLEQEARAAVVLQIAEDAYQARALEEGVSQKMAIPERIHTGQKQRLLADYSFEQATAILEQHRLAISQTWNIGGIAHPIHDLQRYYFTARQPRYILDALQAKLPIAGYGVGLIGAILVYEQQGHFFMHPLKQLLGRASVSLIASPLAAGAIQTNLNFS